MRVHLETQYYPSKRQYRLIGANSSIKLPRQRWYDSYEELTGAVMALNPGIEIV